MRFTHPDRPGRRVLLAYCLNVHPAEDLAGCLEGIRSITLPLRDALAPGERFGVGLYLSAEVARTLARPEGAAALGELGALLEAEALDPFTFNAFPYGGFHSAGLKERVFEPAWGEAARLEYTRDVARVAAALNNGERGHVSISTHPGRFGPWGPGEFERAAENFGRLVDELLAVEAGGGPRLVLGLEAEPRAVAGDTRALARLLDRLHAYLGPRLGAAALSRHLGVCLDTCHSAVEFEEASEAVELASRSTISKLQFTSALALPRPADHPRAREVLLGLDEPRYLHQTTGRGAAGLLRANDLPELARALEGGDSSWLECEEWRTHFHVPVDLAELGSEGLSTTREHAGEILTSLLSESERWGTRDLHLEIETYTWDVLSGPARGAGDLVAGLGREYARVLDLLAAAGWRREPA